MIRFFLHYFILQPEKKKNLCSRVRTDCDTGSLRELFVQKLRKSKKVKERIISISVAVRMELSLSYT